MFQSHRFRCSNETRKKGSSRTSQLHELCFHVVQFRVLSFDFGRFLLLMLNHVVYPAANRNRGFASSLYKRLSPQARFSSFKFEGVHHYFIAIMPHLPIVGAGRQAVMAMRDAPRNSASQTMSSPSHPPVQPPASLKTKNRRKRYLDCHPEYFSADLELAGPLCFCPCPCLPACLPACLLA
jgi:hypothetical protein